MIESFRHKGLKKFFEKGDTSGISAQLSKKIRMRLALLNTCTSPEGMDMPGFKLHQLKGDRKGQWAVSVAGNWRIVFGFENGKAYDVDLVDYH